MTKFMTKPLRYLISPLSNAASTRSVAANMGITLALLLALTGLTFGQPVAAQNKPDQDLPPELQLELDKEGRLKRLPDIFGLNNPPRKPPRNQSEAPRTGDDKAARARSDTKSERAAKKADQKERAEEKRLGLRALLRRRASQHVPDDAFERDKLLTQLYKHLAAAKDKRAARRITRAISRVWMHSGSDTVSVLMGRALRAEKHKKYKKALKYLGFIVKLAPDYAEGWNQRAYIYFKQKDYTRAMGDLRRVLALDPNHYRALEGLGQVMRDIDEKRAALQVFRKLVKVYPANDSARETEKKLAREVLGQKS